MPTPTDRFELDTYDPGESWDHTDTVQFLDESAIEVDTINNRPTDGSYDGELFFATDQRILYQWDAGGSSWDVELGLGVDGTPVPGTSHFETLEATDTTTDTLEATDSITDPEGNTVTSLSDPVRVTEEASTFEESDVTLSNNNTTVSNGSIQLSESQTSGDAIVEWGSGSPVDIESWDLATFQRTLDNETVTVDVIEDNRSDVVFEDFEDGDITIDDSEWGDWSASESFSAQQSTVISGSYSGELASSDDFTSATVFRENITTNDLSVSVQIDTDTGNSDDKIEIVIENDETDLIQNVIFQDDSGDIKTETSQIQSSWNTGTTYEVKFDFDFANDEMDIIINDTNKGTFAFENPSDGVKSLSIKNQTNYSDATRSVFVDDLTEFNRGTLNDLFTDIEQNFDISTVDASKNVKLRANLSRNDTANNPTLDYVARRFTR